MISCNESSDGAYSSLEAGGNGASANCEIKSFSPANKTIRVAHKSGTLTNFSVTPNVSTCKVTYKINNIPVDVEITGGLLNIDSDILAEGENLVEAKAFNEFTNSTVTWTVKKNSLPNCTAQTPSSNGNSISIPGTMLLIANSSDPNNDSLTFNWTINGKSDPSYFTGLISSTSASTVSFVPAPDIIGNNSIEATIYDGYDYGTCEWNVNVTGDCGIASSSPSGSIIRVPNLETTQSLFSVTTNSPGCSANWSLNGVNIDGETSNNQIQSSILNVGNNILTVTLGSGSNAISRTWMVVKNSPPSCSSQTPLNSSTILNGVGVPKTFVAVGSDLNGDSLSFSWLINGNTAGSSISTSSSNLVGTGILLATSNQVGTNTISAIMSDGYDTNTCSWTTTTVDSCITTSSLPASSNTRISATGLPLNFSIIPNDSNCSISWKINGVDFGTGNFIDLFPSNTNILNPPGINTISATLNNGIHTPSVKSWNVVKNTAPICLSPTPSIYTGNSLAIPSTLNFGMVASDSNSDTLSFVWKVNGVLNPTSLGTPTNGGSASLVTFTPTGPNIGNNVVSLDISDGYDSTQCSWNVSVSGDCGVTSESPSTASQIRVAAEASTLNTFSLTTNSLGCTANWTLNGIPLTGNSLSQQIQSSQLLAGANSLTATIPNGVSSTIKSWIILKNTPPICSTSPSNTGTTIAGVGIAKNFQATATDSENDPVTFSWLYNNVNPGSLISSSASGNVGTGIYTGTNDTLGSGVITAVMNDGLDTNRCDWTVNTVAACSVSSSLPSSSSIRLPAFGGIQTFGIVPNNSACLINWELNGSPLGSGNFFDLYSANSNLVTGNNTLTAILSNGIHSGVNQTWTIIKNTPPSCISTSPSGLISINYGVSQALAGTFSNLDGDTYSYSWSFDGGSPALFSGFSSSSGINTETTNGTLTPVYANIGAGHSATITANDGYDSGSCAWTVDVQDPSQVQISSCLPAENPAVIYSQGSNSSRLFTVSATGPSISYQWKLDGVNVGSNSSTHTISAGGLSSGAHTAKVTVTDQYGNAQECNWNLKRNSPPIINTFYPIATSPIKLNINDQLSLGVSATDENSDTLNYNWTINGGLNNTVLQSTLTSTNFNPANNIGFLGSNTISLSVNDGYESSTQSWTVEGNLFSTECNTIFNGPVSGVGATGGKICTLIGTPGVGNGLDPLEDQGQIKIQPTYVIDDGSGNLLFSDIQSHTVFYYNRSSITINKFGKEIPAGRLVALAGNGMNGKNDDLSYNTDFKLSTPLGLAYDSTNEKLFIADNANNRVVMLNNSGQVLTIFGTGGTTQTAGNNSDGVIGTQIVCGSPQDLEIIGSWLYISCFGTNAIKKMDIDSSSVNYLKGYMVIGPLNSTSQVIAGNANGTTGTTGLARANGPLGLASDGDGNLYWTDYNTSRVRMLNLSGINKTFFPLPSISANFNIGMADLSTTAITAPSNIVLSAQTSSVAPDNLYLWGPTKVVTNTCVHYRVQSRKGTVPSKAQGAINVTLNSGGIGTFYLDSSCSSSTSSVNIANDTAEVDFYYKRASGTGAVSFTIGSLTNNGPLSVTVTNAGGTANKLVLFGPNSFEYQTCTKLMLQVQDSSSLPTTSSSNRIILLSHDNTGNFYSESTCTTTPINSTTLIAGSTREAYIYFAKTTIAPPGEVISLFGNANSTLYASGGASSVTLRQPRDLLVDYNGSTIRGFYVSTNNTTANDTHHRLVYVNNEVTDRTLGGVLISGTNQNGVPGANHGGVAIAGITSSGYNGDNSPGGITKIYYPWGLTFDSTGSNIIFSDHQNFRLRSLDISSTNGSVNTILGLGRLRNGFISDSQVAATDAYLNGPSKAVIDSTHRVMYLSDSTNGRIRKVDLLKGYVETFVGRGLGDANIDPEDPLFVYTRSVRGMTLANSGSNQFLIYTDNQATTGVNTTCLVRAVNLGTTSASIFGVTIGANKVATIAGDFNLGCNTFTSTGPALTKTLNQPEDLAFDGSNLYITVYNDHCILKLNSSGTLSSVMGTCGVAGDVDGFTPNTGSLALTRNPMAISADLAIPGNFFIGDQYGQNTGRIKYVNTTINSIDVGGATVPANNASNTSRILTLWNLIPQGSVPSRINSIASFGNIVCWAAGLTGNGNDGPHAVYCGDKTTGTVSRKAGPSEQSSNYIRGAAPLGREQENVTGVSSLLGAPYGLTFDGDGNLYIVERSTHTVRMMRRWF